MSILGVATVNLYNRYDKKHCAFANYPILNPIWDNIISHAFHFHADFKISSVVSSGSIFIKPSVIDFWLLRFCHI